MANDNQVLGHPERVFRDAWLAIQWKAMARTGKGYRRPPAPTRAQAARDAERLKAEAEAAKAAAA